MLLEATQSSLQFGLWCAISFQCYEVMSFPAYGWFYNFLFFTIPMLGLGCWKYMFCFNWGIDVNTFHFHPIVIFLPTSWWKWTLHVVEYVAPGLFLYILSTSPLGLHFLSEFQKCFQFVILACHEILVFYNYLTSCLWRFMNLCIISTCYWCKFYIKNWEGQGPIQRNQEVA